jgi:hypothetical protein
VLFSSLFFFSSMRCGVGRNARGVIGVGDQLLQSEVQPNVPERDRRLWPVDAGAGKQVTQPVARLLGFCPRRRTLKHGVARIAGESIGEGALFFDGQQAPRGPNHADGMRT